MNNCCDLQSKTKVKKKEVCPQCNAEQNITSYQTVLHHLKTPYVQQLDEQRGYYFCRNTNCDTVYFDTENKVFGKEDVRMEIGQKSNLDTRQICYCFDVTFDKVVLEIEEKGFSEIKEFVKSQTKAKNCACEIRNPAGRCCLIDFPKG